MRARTAYISSIGTTTILVAASLLMLGLVSALVAFHRWPDGAVGQTVPSVVLRQATQPVVRVAPDAPATPLSRVLAGSRALGGRAATAGLVKNVSVRVPAAVGFPLAVEPGHAGEPAPARNARPPSPPPTLTPPAAPPTPGDVAALVQGIVGGVQPPPPGSANPAPVIQVSLPVKLH
jgi:hypothetical protein